MSLAGITNTKKTAALSAGSYSVGCAIMAGAIFGAGLNFVGQSTASTFLGEPITGGKEFKWLGQGAVDGGAAGYAGTLPKGRFWLPAEAKIVRHHGPDVARIVKRGLGK